MIFSTQAAVSAEVTPPPPGPPPPPGLPIDGGLVILFLFALFVGFYFSKKYILNKKGSF